MRWLIRFFWQVVVCAFSGRNYIETGIKDALFITGIASLVLLGLKIKPETKVYVSLPESQREITLSMYLVIAGLVVAVWLLLALGAGWVYSHRSSLRIGNHLTAGLPYYRVSVHNDGTLKGEVELSVRRVTDADGNSLDDEAYYELRWEGLNEGQRPQISSRLPAIACVCTFLHDSNINGHRIVLRRLAGPDYKVRKGLPQFGSCWIELLAQDQHGAWDAKWFFVNLAPSPHDDGDRVLAGTPVFTLRWWQRLRRWTVLGICSWCLGRQERR